MFGQAKRLGLVGMLATASLVGTTSAQDSNRDEVRANLERGWEVIWGKNFTEADWARGSKAIAESIATENPGPFLQWFGDVVRENFQKIQQRFPGLARSEFDKLILRSLKSKQIASYKRLRIEAGFATYNRWKRVIVEVPDGWDFKRNKPKFKKIEQKVPLPNWHQFYIRYRI